MRQLCGPREQVGSCSGTGGVVVLCMSVSMTVSGDGVMICGQGDGYGVLSGEIGLNWPRWWIGDQQMDPMSPMWRVYADSKSVVSIWMSMDD